MTSMVVDRDSVVAAADTAVKPRRVSRKKLLLGAVILLAGLGGAKYGYDYWTVGRFIEETDDAYVGGNITVIAPKVPGLITQVAVTDNQAVHAGDLLVKIDDRDYRAAVARAEAAVAAQQAALANLDATRHLSEAKVAEARAGIVAANAEVVRTRADVARYRQLVQSAFASQQRLQQVDADNKKGLAAVDSARAALDAAERQLAVIDTQKQQVRAALAEAEANLDIAKLNLSYTELRAPVDGTIGNRSARVGAYATTGAQLLSVVPAQGLWVDANFKESQLAHMHPGLPVTVVADVLPGRDFHGHVVSLAPATGAQFSVLPAENATGNFTKIVQRVPVRVQLDGDAARLGLLRPGLSVVAEVDTRSARNGAAATKDGSVP